MKKIHIIYLFILFLAHYSCTEPIDLELKNEASNILVVDGSITNEHKIHSVTLSRSAAYQLNDITPRELNAAVTITDGDTIINLYDLDNDGTYETEHELAGKINHVYTLNVILENGETYSATDSLYPITPLDSISCDYGRSDDPFNEENVYNIHLFVQEPPEPGQYYQWEFYIDNVHQTDTITAKQFASDEFVNGSYFNDENWTVYEIEKERIENDTVEIKLQMLSISKKKFDFYTAVMLETEYGGSMFSGPPANVPTNVTSGDLVFLAPQQLLKKR
jgi:hypothetical protein